MEEVMIESSQSDHSTPGRDCVNEGPKTDHGNKTDNGNKTDHGNGSKGKPSTGGKGQDSPAFRLRPRRSTPKPSPLLSVSGHKRSYTSLLPGPILESTGSTYTTVESVKRKLFKILSKDSDDDGRRRFERPPSPTSSIKSDVNLCVFLERINIDDLEPNQRYPLNYVCLRIIRMDKTTEPSPVQTGSSSPPVQTGSSSPPVETGSSVIESNPESSPPSLQQEKSLVVYAQEPDGRFSPSRQGSHDPSKPVIKAILHDAYANTPDLSIGKVIEVTKFETSVKSEEDESMPIDGKNNCDPTLVHSSLPFTLVIKPSPSWVPIISIKSEYNSINNPLLLTVDTTNKKSEIPSPGLRFTSYVTKVGSSRRSVSLDDLSCIVTKQQTVEGKNCKSGLVRRTSPRTSVSCTKSQQPDNLNGRSLRNSGGNGSKNVSPALSTTSSSSTIITSPHSPICGQSSSMKLTPASRMKEIDFSTSSASRVTKNSRRVSVTP